MRLSLRFIVPLAVVLAAIAYGVIPLVDQLTLKWFVRDLDIRATLITNTTQELLGQLIQDGNRSKVQRYPGRLTQDERLFAVGFCDAKNHLAYKTAAFPDAVKCKAQDSAADEPSHLVQLARGPVRVAIKAVEFDNAVYGSLVLVQDMSFIQLRSDDTKKYIFYLFVGI